MRNFGQRVGVLIVSAWCGWACAAGRACAAAPAESDLDVIRGSAQTQGFAQAVEPRKFEFPADHGPHPAFRHEWWYVTGNVDSASGERFGFELTFFRFALAPLGAGGPVASAGSVAAGLAASAGPAVSAAPSASAWRARQIYAAHFAITDVARGQFRFTQKRSRDALGMAGAQADPLRVWLDDWQIVASGASPGWSLHAAGEGYDLTLQAEPLLQPVLNGERGLSRKSGEPGAASYYYSIPRIAVHGKVVRSGVATAVSGVAWLDREWGSGSLGTHQQGWDWFALQLQDGSALMFYSLRNRDGTRDSHSAGTWVDPAGHAQALSAGDVAIDVGDHWASPRGGRYPSRWRVRIASVGVDVEAKPVLADQELGTRPRYWEGAVDVHGTQKGRDISGRGYVELVGYGE